MKGIKINGDDEDVLSVRLENILNCIQNRRSEVFWGVLWVYVTIKQGVNCNVLEFEEGVNKSEHGKLFSLDKILRLSGKIDQAIELLVIGDTNIENITKYKSDELMRENCEYIIELVDSSFWLVYTKDDDFIQNIFQELPGVKYNE